MNRTEFINELNEKLVTLSSNDREEAISYYSEIIDDAVEEGKSEKKAIKELGDINDIIKRIIESQETNKSSHNDIFTKRLLFILASPFIFSGIALLISMFLVAYSVILSLYCIVFSTGLITIAYLINFFLVVFTFPAFGIFSIGLSVLSFGMTILIVLGTNKLLYHLNDLSKKSWQGLKIWLRGGFGNEK